MIKKALVLFFLVVNLIPGKSQNIDSLKNLLLVTEGIERADVLYRISSLHLRPEPNLASDYAREGYALAKELNDSLNILKNGGILASALRRRGKIDSAIIIYREILPITEKSIYKGDRMWLLNGYALSLTFRADYDKALKAHFEAIDLSNQSKDSLSLTISLHNVGLVFYKLKDYQKALDYFKVCKEIKHKINDQFDIDVLAINMSLCYAYLKKFSEAEEYVNQGLKLCGRTCNSETILQGHFAKGVIHFGQNDYLIAESHFLKSYSIAEDFKDVRLQLDNVDYLFQIYLKANDVGQAKFYLENAQRSIEQNPSFSLEMINIYARFSELYIRTKDFEKASNYQLKCSQLKDTFFNESVTINLMKTEAQYLERENTAKIALQSELIRVKEEIIIKKENLNYVTGLLILMCLGFLFVTYKNYYHKKKLNRILERKIGERTRQLQISRDELIKACIERDVLIDRASEEVTEAVNRIRGLCMIANREGGAETGSYLTKVEETSQSLNEYFKALFLKRVISTI